MQTISAVNISAILLICCIFPVAHGVMYGSIALITDYPYQVSIFVGGVYKCGGVILADVWVATAAQCFDETMTSSMIDIGAGEASLFAVNFLKYRHYAEQIITHPQFDKETFDNDIALLKINVDSTHTAFNFTLNEISPASIAALNQETKVGAPVTIVGYGTSEFSTTSPLRNITVSLLSQVECNHNLARFGGITTNMLCTHDSSGHNRDACQGDAGSAVSYAGNVIGLVSWGLRCGQDHYAGVLTKLSSPSVRNFINSHVGI